MIFGPTPYPDIQAFVRREIVWARQRGIAFTEADGLLGRHTCSRRRAKRMRPGERSRPSGSLLPSCTEVRLAARGERRPGCLDRDRRRRSRNGRILLPTRWKPWRGASILSGGGRQPSGSPTSWSNWAATGSALLDDIEQRGLTWGARPKSRYLQARETGDGQRRDG